MEREDENIVKKKETKDKEREWEKWGGKREGRKNIRENLSPIFVLVLV